MKSDQVFGPLQHLKNLERRVVVPRSRRDQAVGYDAYFETVTPADGISNDKVDSGSQWVLTL